MRALILASAALLGLAGAAAAQTAGGPDRASPGAMPSDTPLTNSGTPRAAATPATPADIGADKPARPRAVRHRRVPAKVTPQ